MKVKLKKVSNQFDKIVKKLMDSSGHNVQIGWFAEQGLHGPSGMPFTRLAAIHHNGINVPKRPILSVVANLRDPPKNSANVKRILKQFILNPQEPDKVFDELGKHYVRIVKSYFGSSYLHPTEHNPNPLIDTGEFKRNTAYKTSISGQVKKEGGK